MNRIALILIPTARASSLGNGQQQLSYIWSINNGQAWTPQSHLPPVVTDIANQQWTLSLVLWSLNSFHGGLNADLDNAPKLTVSGNSPVGVQGDLAAVLGTDEFDGGWVWNFPLTAAYPGFRFRVSISNVNGDATIYTVDPEMVVSEHEGPGVIPGS